MSLIHNFGWVGLPPSAAMEVERVEERCQVPFFGHPQFRVVLFSPNHATAFGPLSRRPVWRAQFYALRTSSMLFIDAKKVPDTFFLHPFVFYTEEVTTPDCCTLPVFPDDPSIVNWVWSSRGLIPAGALLEP